MGGPASTCIDSTFLIGLAPRLLVACEQRSSTDPDHHRGRAARPGHRAAHRRGRPRRSGLRVRIGPLVLPGRIPHAVGSIGHEFIGVVEDVGAEVTAFTAGPGRRAVHLQRHDLPELPATVRRSPVPVGGTFGNGHIDGGQGEAVRVPLAGSTLVPVPGTGHSDEVMQVVARPLRRDGDRAPRRGQCRRAARDRWSPSSVMARSGSPPCSRRSGSGAERIIALSRHPERQQVAKEFGATDIVEERGEAANDKVLELTGGFGVDARIECVGTAESIATAFAIAKAGSTVGVVGVPHGRSLLRRGLLPQHRVGRWSRPARIYIPELMSRRVGRTHRPRASLRLRNGPRRDPRCVRRHGHAASHQVHDSGERAVNEPTSQWSAGTTVGTTVGTE